MHIEPRPQKFHKVSVVILDVDPDSIKQLCQDIIQCESHVSKSLILVSLCFGKPLHRAWELEILLQ